MSRVDQLAEYVDEIVELMENPTSWLREHVFELIVQAFLSLVFEFVALLVEIGELLLDSVIGSAARAALGSLATVGAIPLYLVQLVNDLLITVATAAGPAAPIVYVGLWAALVAISLELGAQAYTHVIGRIPVIST